MVQKKKEENDSQCLKYTKSFLCNAILVFTYQTKIRLCVEHIIHGWIKNKQNGNINSTELNKKPLIVSNHIGRQGLEQQLQTQIPIIKEIVSTFFAFFSFFVWHFRKIESELSLCGPNYIEDTGYCID